MSQTTPAAEAEATSETTTFEHFGRTWTVPTRMRLSHQRALRSDPTNVGIVETFLNGDDLAALDEINPTLDELDGFTDAIVGAMGLGDAPN